MRNIGNMVRASQPTPEYCTSYTGGSCCLRQ